MATTAPMHIGTAHIECPECHQVIPVPVTAEVVPGEPGRLNLECKPDMADLWAHAWSHQ